MRETTKVLGFNILLAGCLVLVGNALAIAYERFDDWRDQARRPSMSDLPNYRNHQSWAETYFREDAETRSAFFSYYGWRRLPYQGETVNIDEQGLRHTVAAPDAEETVSIGFFGGSTIWGTGVRDGDTIPSLFAMKEPAFRATNHGEAAYTAHQSLNLLMKLYYRDMKRFDVVVFYDGINEVLHKCRRENDPFAYRGEAGMREVLRTNSLERPQGFVQLVAPIQRFIEKVKRSLASRSAESYYDCDQDPAKAEAVARLLLADWSMAKHIVETHGGRFQAILQPVLFLSETNRAHLKINDELGRQYEIVYPIIRQMLQEEFPELVPAVADLTDALDRPEDIYIDFAHLSPNGNQIIAERISTLVDASDR